jgi:hypothetical protein
VDNNTMPDSRRPTPQEPVLSADPMPHRAGPSAADATSHPDVSRLHAEPIQTMSRDCLTIAADLDEAAATLKRAAAIDDPSMRSDATWEAIERLSACSGPVAGFAGRVAGRLEDGGDGTRRPPAGRELQRQARILDEQVRTLVGISEGFGRAASEPARAGINRVVGR